MGGTDTEDWIVKATLAGAATVAAGAPSLLTEQEVRELAGAAVDSDEFPRPNQYGPAGRKWLDSDVKKWLGKRAPKKTVRRPKDEGETVETRPVD